MKDWEEFEKLVKHLHEDAEPDAEVRHNHWVKGRSGRRRKLDITITKNIGPYPIMIVFDCKYQRRPVNIDQVGASHAQFQDVRASRGVMVSNSGFDQGAIDYARDNAITLLSYREAESVDWQAVMKDGVSMRLVQPQNMLWKAVGIAEDGSSLELAANESIYASDGTLIGTPVTIYEANSSNWQVQVPIGKYSAELETSSGPLIIRRNGTLHRLRKVTLVGENKKIMYEVNLQLAFGYVLEGSSQGDKGLHEFITQGFDWREAAARKEGRELTQEEYDEFMQKDIIDVQLSGKKQIVSLRINGPHITGAAAPSESSHRKEQR